MGCHDNIRISARYVIAINFKVEFNYDHSYSSNVIFGSFTRVRAIFN